MVSLPTRIFPELIRLNVSLSVTLSAFAAWVVKSGIISEKSVLPLAAIFLLSCGASVMNQVQEKEPDARMDRTRNRSLPSGKITSGKALSIAFLFLISGFAILASASYWNCVILGLLNILWYNGFYTWMKKKTAFAVVPGALCGVIPVFMGWSAAGGSIFDLPALFLAFFLFMWQIPHFWLLMLKYEGEYRLAGFPVMTDTFSKDQFRNIIFAWMIGAAGTSLLLLLSGFWIFCISKALVAGMNLFILAIFFLQLYINRNPRYRLMFITMNTFLLLMLSLVILEQFFL